VDSKSQVDELELHIREIIHRLLELAVTPHIRELRAKAVTYGRVIGGWTLYPPTQPQFQAMTECVDELNQKVTEASQDAAAAMRESGRMPSSRGMKPMSPSPSPPAIRPIQGSEFDAFEAALRGEDPDATAIHSRHRAARKTRSTKPPPAKAPSFAPPSQHRPASDTRPTPVPALLQTRRSR
jgi:hypothetical protein